MHDSGVSKPYGAADFHGFANRICEVLNRYEIIIRLFKLNVEISIILAVKWDKHM